MVKVVFRSANLRFAPSAVKHNLSTRDYHAHCRFGKDQLGFNHRQRQTGQNRHRPTIEQELTAVAR
jgi:hypothetical protein